MRQKLVFFAVACLVALPLAAAPAVPVQGQAVATAPAVSAQQTVAPAATPATATPLALGVSPITSLGSPPLCNTNSDCTTYCEQVYGSPSFGRCVNYRCTCIF